MTQDEIADIYQKANGWSPRAYPNTMAELEAFAKLIAEVEREACAEICDDMKPSEATFDKRFFVACTLNAQAIRARGQE